MSNPISNPLDSTFKFKDVCESFVLVWCPGLIKQFLRDVDWGTVDYLIIDTPPGTSDEHLSVVTYTSAAQVDGAVIVTTPQVSVDTYCCHGV